MLFSLEAVQAHHGDCLLLHYGSPDDPRLIVIDGGPVGIYPNYLKPRLNELREAFQNRMRAAGALEFEIEDAALPVRMLMVSHIDDDHIHGVQDLLADLKDGPRAIEIETVWHNSFDDLIGNETGELGPASLATVAAAFGGRGGLAGGKGPESAAIVANVEQGRTVRRDAMALGLASNDPFEGLVMASGANDNRADQGDGLALQVVGPDRGRLEALQTEWNAQIKEMGVAETAAYLDRSIFNLSSIVVLATREDRSILLTGDARGDEIIAGLEAAGLLTDGKIHVDLLKVPHHGSSRNLTTAFFQRVTADHYVISGDGKYDNPKIETLQMISEARGNADFTLHLTNRRLKAGDPERLDQFFAAEQAAGKSYRVVYPAPGENSVRVDLLEPPEG